MENKEPWEGYCFPTKKLAEYYGKQFQNIYNEKYAPNIFARFCYWIKNKLSFKKLKQHKIDYTVLKTLNEGWKPNWSDHNQKKFYPYINNTKN